VCEKRQKMTISEHKMELQERMQGFHYTDQELIDNYYNVKEKVGKVPTFRDICNKEISAVLQWQYVKRYGTWNNFLKTISERPNPKRIISYSEKDFVDNYYKIKEKLGRVTGYRDITNKQLSRMSIGVYYNRYGNYTNFLKSIGETPNLEHMEHIHQELIDNYHEVENKLGRFPTSNDIYNPEISNIRTQYYKDLVSGTTS
jgi:hypothetical protein